MPHRTKETRQDQTFKVWDYTEMNRVWHAYTWRDPSRVQGEVSIYEYDLAGNLHSVTDGKGSQYIFDYDLMGRKVRAQYPDDAAPPPLIGYRTEAWAYDDAGNLRLYKNPKENFRHFTHDYRDRETLSYWNNSPTSEDPDISIGPKNVTTYDDATNVMSITTNDGETALAFGYDPANRKIWEDQMLAGQPTTRRVKTDLNEDGKRQNLQIIVNPVAGAGAGMDRVYRPDMKGAVYEVNYDYTARNELKSITGASGENWTYTYRYDKSGNLLSRTADYVNESGDPVTSSTACVGPDFYDPLNRPTRWQQSSPSENAVFSLTTYTYDQVNRETDAIRSENQNRGEHYTFDATNQLSTATYNRHVTPRSVSYTYEADKLNRKSVTENGVTTDYSVNAMNQYEAVGGSTLSYDENFNLHLMGGLTLNYDAASRLTSASNGSMNLQFTYDGLGRCVKRVEKGVATLVTFDGWKPIAEWDEWGFFESWNVYGSRADEILLRHEGKMGYLRFQSDAHGNVEFLVDNDGNGLERYEYDAFGKPKRRCPAFS